jgi:hypothetical protein
MSTQAKLRSGSRTIPIQTLAKPRHGRPCNGCGYCCISEVCALGLELGDRSVCRALVRKVDGSYSCGLVMDPYRFMPAEQAETWRRIDTISAGAGEQAAKDFHAQMLGAGRGCDSYKR